MPRVPLEPRLKFTDRAYFFATDDARRQIKIVIALVLGDISIWFPVSAAVALEKPGKLGAAHLKRIIGLTQNSNNASAAYIHKDGRSSSERLCII